VNVDTDVKGDAVVAGGSVRINGSVGESLYLAGAQLMLDGAIGRNARIGGGRVEIGPKATVAGGVSVGGGEVNIDGKVKGYVQAAAGTVRINGTIGGDVVATGGAIELGPEARIAGKLRYASRDELQRDPGAQVAGGVEPMPFRGAAAHPEPSVFSAGSVIWTAGLMLLAILLVVALPAVASSVSNTLLARPWMSLLIGFIVLICVPVAAVLLLITVIGIPLALLTLALYSALLIVGYTMTGIGVGDWVLRRFRAADASRSGWRTGAAVVALLAIAILARVPVLGRLLTFVVLIAGVGALALQFRTARTATT
jgi:cytoskeletal protein CcmA (bactofilin family)